MPDPDVEIRGVGKGRSSRPLDKGGGDGGGGGGLQQFFLALRASVWSKNKGREGPRVPPLDPPVVCVTIQKNGTRRNYTSGLEFISA